MTMDVFETEGQIENGGLLRLQDLPFSVGQHVHVQVKPSDTDLAQRKPFIFGLHQGKVEMSDDFDDPLPDSFWLGEDEDPS